MIRGMDVLLRQVCLLSLLPRAPRRIAVEALRDALADCGFEVDLPTIRRDLRRLSRVFPIACDDSRPAGWCWAADAPPLPAGAYEPSLAAGLALGVHHLGDALPASLHRALRRHVERARRTLEAQGPGGLGGLVARFRAVAHGGAGHAPSVDEAVLEAVARAVATSRRLTVRHREETRGAVLDPLGLVRRGPTLHLVARMARGPQVLTFALHRLRSARLHDEPADVSGFDLDAWLAGGAAITLVARVRPEGREALEDAPLAADQHLEPLPDGACRLWATVVADQSLRSRLLSFGAALVVESPETLVAEMATEARALATAYGVP